MGGKCSTATNMLVKSEEEVNPGPRHQIHALKSTLLIINQIQHKRLLFMALYFVSPCSCVYGIATIHIKLLSRRDPWRLNFLLYFSNSPIPLHALSSPWGRPNNVVDSQKKLHRGC